MASGTKVVQYGPGSIPAEVLHAEEREIVRVVAAGGQRAAWLLKGRADGGDQVVSLKLPVGVLKAALGDVGMLQHDPLDAPGAEVGRRNERQRVAGPLDRGQAAILRWRVVGEGPVFSADLVQPHG